MHPLENGGESINAVKTRIALAEKVEAAIGKTFNGNGSHPTYNYNLMLA